MPPAYTALILKRFFLNSTFKLPLTTTLRTPLKRFASVKVDQTKEDNNPASEHKRSHKTQVAETTSTKRDKAHPAQQPDPQKEPSRSTGIKMEGPDGVKAGMGTD